MFRSITNNVSKNLSAGGELTGDVTITGDLSVTGSSSITVNEVIQGTSTIDVDNTEALLVRKNGDAGDVFIVDTTNSNVKIPNGLLELGTADSSSGHINAFENMSFNIDTDDDDTNRFFEFSINGSSGGGTELMRLTEGGLLGIGVQPSVALHVSGDIQLDDSAPFLLFKETGSNKDMQFKLQTDGRMSLLNDNAATEVLTVLQNGSLGIGEISPDALLHLKSSTDGKPIIKIEQSGNNVNGGGLIFLTSGTANDNDDSGVIRFKGMNDAGTPEEIEYATIYVNHDDVSDGSEDATMHFRTQSGGSLGSRLVIQGSNVGIGTSSPDRPLHVSGATPLRLERGSVAEYDFNIDNLVTGDASDLTFAAVTNGTGYLFQTKDSAGSAVNALAINHDGEIGIGTTNPAKELHVAKSGEAQMLIDSHVAGGSGSSIRLRQSRNTTIGSHTVVNDNDEVGDITFQGSDGNSYESVASIRGKVDDGSISDGSIGGSLVFKTGSSNGTRLILDDNSRISLTNNDAGASNTIFGYLAGDDIASGGNYNCLFGQQAGADITTGEKNVAYGYQALFNHTDGDRNVALGYGALMALDGTESRNIGIGYFAGDSLNNNATVDNIFIGDSAGRAGAGEVIGCVGIGTGVMQSIGANNHTGTIGIGYNALGALTTGIENTAIGYNAGVALTTSRSNTILGYSAMHRATTASDYNTAIGAHALNGSFTTADVNFCVAVGYASLQGILTSAASGTTAIGYASLANNTSGTGNAALGYQSGGNLTTGSRNLAIGHNALYQADVCDDSIAIGFEALGGTDAGANNKNIAIGNYALDANMTHNVQNIAIGYNSLTNLAGSGGISNTFVGNTSGMSLTNADYNTGVGEGVMGEASGNAITGEGNSALGALAGYNLEGIAHSNTLIGYGAGNASNAITTGISNVCIGDGASTSSATADNQISIGTGAVGQANNSVTLGNGSVTKVYMSSDGDAEMYANGTINTSDKRLKENINDSDLGLSFVNALRPVSYKFIDDKKPEKLKYGIIAQEVQEVLKESGNEDFAGITDKGDYLGADYVQFIAPLIKAVQELSAKVEALEKK